MRQVLKGVKVLDLTRLLPGPYCSLILANHGARVVKVEEPGLGDYMRDFGEKNPKGICGWYHMLNVGKESVTINLKKPQGTALLRKLAAQSDVLMEGFRPGIMKKLGLGYQELKKINPRLVYCSISGYGQYGPYKNKAGHDINYLGLNGVLSYSGCPDAPRAYGVQIADISSALYSAIGISMALYKRAADPSHVGEYLDISLFDSAFVWNCLALGSHYVDPSAPKPGCGILNNGIAAYNTYQTKDGRYMTLGALEKKFWDNFCRVINHPEYSSFDHMKMGPEQLVMKQNLQKIFLEKTLQEWTTIFEGKDCCCDPVHEIAEAVKHPQVKSRGMIQHMEDGDWFMGDPIKFGTAKVQAEAMAKVGKAPKVGEHTERVLTEIAGLKMEEIEALKKSGVVA